MDSVFRYIKNVLIGVDQLATTLIGGYPDETLSSYAWRLERQGKFFGFWRRVIDAIFFWQDGHCERAVQSERERKQMPPDLRL